ncbi:MAG TPA: CPBP family glutamic-type intramembrane protease [Candidatus Angelobacter sp.]|nr:CPBP family glutamic-type intramembrane protease [Candidatus Angelobacter sp.]
MSQAPRSIPGIITAIAIAFVVLTYALSFVITIAAIIATQLGSNLLSLNGFLPLEIFLILVPGVLPANGLGLVLGFMVIFALCFWAAAKDRGGFIKSLAGLTRKAKPTSTPNWLAVMPLLSSFLLVLTVILTISLNSAGVPVGNIPQNNPAELFASVTFAPVAEEIGFRITPIGLIVVIRTLLPLHWGRGLRNAGATTVAMRILIALISPDRAKQAAGLPSIGTHGWRGIHWAEWILLAASSAWFGLLHSLSGAGWGPGKAIPAGLTGLALGIVYLWYGAYANILLHWFFDFYNFTIFGAILGGSLFDILASLAVLTSLFLGVAGFVYGIRWLKPERPPPMQPPMTQTPQPQF